MLPILHKVKPHKNQLPPVCVENHSSRLYMVPSYIKTTFCSPKASLYYIRSNGCRKLSKNNLDLLITGNLMEKFSQWGANIAADTIVLKLNMS